MNHTAHLQKELEILRETCRDLKERLTILTASHETFELDDVEAHLSATQRTILKILADRMGKSISKDRIYAMLYAARISSREHPDPKIVDVFICKIRERLKGSPWSIKTHWGEGYSLHRSNDAAAVDAGNRMGRTDG